MKYNVIVMSNHKSNNLVRQVLKEIIADPPSSNRKSCDIEQFKLTQAVTYLQRKIERQQTEIKVLSEQLGIQIQAKEHLIMLLNEQKQKNCKLNQHLNNSNRSAAQSKKKLAKFELIQSKQAKIKEEYELKLAKCRDILRKKEDMLAKANARIEDLQKTYASISSIQGQLKDVREQMQRNKKREDELQKQNESMRNQIKLQKEQIQLKDEAVLFSEEHLRRLRQQYQQLQEGYYHQQQESRMLQIEMKQLLQQQNQQIKQLNEKLKCKQEVEQCIKSDRTLSKSQIYQFEPQKPEWQLTIFKKQVKRAIDTHVDETQLKQKLQSDILLIFQAVETSFNSILSQVMSGLE